MRSSMHFSVEAAVMYGVNNAIFLEYIAEYVDYARINHAHAHEQRNIEDYVRYFDGRYWVYEKADSLYCSFRFFSPKEFNDILNSCVKRDLLRISGNFENGLWIALGDSAYPYTELNERCEGSKPAEDRYNGNKDFVHERDGEKCAICGRKNRLCVHHIDGYDRDKPENSSANKMILLCGSCHCKVHGKKNPLKIPEKELERIGYFEKE